MEIYSLDEMREAIRNDETCKTFAVAIAKTYQNRQFYVDVHDHGRVATIKVPAISMSWGMVVHLKGVLEIDVGRVVHAAGELLERFNLTRGRTDNHDVFELERNISGEAVNAKKGEL